MLQSLIFLIRCGRNDDSAPLSSFQYLSSIKSLILALFNSILGPKKILWIRPANLRKNPSRGRNPYFHTRYSNENILSFWYWNQAIQKPKFIYVSRTITLMRDSKWDKFVLNNRIATKLGWKLSRGRILCFHARFQTGISWAFNIEIKPFKSPNSSMCSGL
jgi:hypothetical protein